MLLHRLLPFREVTGHVLLEHLLLCWKMLLLLQLLIHKLLVQRRGGLLLLHGRGVLWRSLKLRRVMRYVHLLRLNLEKKVGIYCMRFELETSTPWPTL